MTLAAELPVTFWSGRNQLFGVLHRPGEVQRTGIVILVGGPQYRVGSHRMFVQMAREFVRGGYCVLRFDFAGMGDSGGDFRGFKNLAGDIKAAIEELTRVCPNIRRIVLMGLCDGATAGALYCASDERVNGLVLLNPWVHTPIGEATTYLWHYYPQRLLQGDFWRGLLRQEVSISASLSDFVLKMGRVLIRRTESRPSDLYVDHMRCSLERFEGQVLVVASQHDYTALQFIDLWTKDKRWEHIREAAQFASLSDADHSLSSRSHMIEFCSIVVDWLSQHFADSRSRTA